MNFIKKIWNEKLKDPHGIWLVLFFVLTIFVIAGTLVLVVFVPNQMFYHYILYVFAAVMLAYAVYAVAKLAPKIKQSIIARLKKHKFTNEILEEYGYRTMIFGIISLVLNIAYVAIIGVFGILSKSVWYISITAYYLTLIFMKGNIYLSKKRHNTPLKKARAYRFCGIMFIFLTIALSGIIVLIYKANNSFEYAGLLIYVFAAYTFYKLTMSIINIFKARKHDNLYVQSIRNVNFTASLVSIFVLQVALFQAFSPASNTGVANGLTGGAVSAAILALGIFMIVKASKEIKQINSMEKTNEE